jgi:hypothetical protein
MDARRAEPAIIARDAGAVQAALRSGPEGACPPLFWAVFLLLLAYLTGIVMMLSPLGVDFISPLDFRFGVAVPVWMGIETALEPPP